MNHLCDRAALWRKIAAGRDSPWFLSWTRESTRPCSRTWRHRCEKVSKPKAHNLCPPIWREVNRSWLFPRPINKSSVYPVWFTEKKTGKTLEKFSDLGELSDGSWSISIWQYTRGIVADFFSFLLLQRRVQRCSFGLTYTWLSGDCPSLPSEPGWTVAHAKVDQSSPHQACSRQIIHSIALLPSLREQTGNRHWIICGLVTIH